MSEYLLSVTDEMGREWLAAHDRTIRRELGERLAESGPCLEHRSCTCRYALVGLGIQLQRENKKEKGDDDRG